MNAKGDEYEYLPGGLKKWKADRNCVTGWNGKSFQDERKNILHTQALYFLPRTKIFLIEVTFSLEIVFVYLRRDRWGEAVWITNWGEACRGGGGKKELHNNQSKTGAWGGNETIHPIKLPTGRTDKKFKDLFVFLFVVKELHIEIAKSRNSIEDNILCHRKIFGSLSQSNWIIQKVKWQCCRRSSHRF